MNLGGGRDGAGQHSSLAALRARGSHHDTQTTSHENAADKAEAEARECATRLTVINDAYCWITRPML